MFHRTNMPAVTISKIIFPPIQQPPDWVHVIALVGVTVVATVILESGYARSPLTLSHLQSREEVIS